LFDSFQRFHFNKLPLKLSSCHRAISHTENHNIRLLSGLSYSNVLQIYIEKVKEVWLALFYNQNNNKKGKEGCDALEHRAIFNKDFIFFSKTGEQEGKTGPVWAVGTSGKEGCRERVCEGEYGANTWYICMKCKNETC
jgi:hypothetical protein